MDKLNQSADVSQKQFENGKVEENEAEDGMVGTDEECRSTSAVKEADMDMESDYSDIPEWEKSELSDSDEMDMKSDDSDIPEWNDSELSDSDGMDIGSDDSYDSGIHEPNDFHLPFSNFTTASPVYRNKFVANGINRDGSVTDEDVQENAGQAVQENKETQEGIDRKDLPIGVPARGMDNCNHNDPTEQETLGLQGNAIIPIQKGRNQQAYSASLVSYAGCQQENIIQAVQETGADEETKENDGQTIQESGGVPARVMDNCNHNDPTEQETLGLQGNAIIPILKGRNQQAYSVSPVPYAGCQQENIIQAVQETGVTDEESQENVGKAFQIEWSK
ncbi:uncharacterized protein LOC134256617 isoform X3 [Saccostrea cucullata]|uniref:uncharacterized protein LOC134256617 isoform X3 n=1 Tax=Saccostrea cuccullata TaxID=36930 RepID=UPI002ED62563